MSNIKDRIGFPAFLCNFGKSIRYRDELNPEHDKLNFFKYVGPGLLVTVGFIDPGNWASNVAAGSSYGYKLLWMVTLATIMLIVLQHNAAHLEIGRAHV
jgi:manganese transport protein